MPRPAPLHRISVHGTTARAPQHGWVPQIKHGWPSSSFCIAHFLHSCRYRRNTAHDDTRCKLLYVCQRDHGRANGFLSANSIAVKEITTEERAEATKLLATAADRHQAGLGFVIAGGEGGRTHRRPPPPWDKKERAGLSKMELVKVLVVYAREYPQHVQLQDSWVDQLSAVAMGERIRLIILAREQQAQQGAQQQ